MNKTLDDHTIAELFLLTHDKLVEMLVESQEQLRTLRGIYHGLSTGEPVFVLRAQDILAPDTVRYWADQMIMIQGENSPKVREALQVANDMETWQQTQARKIPD